MHREGCRIHRMLLREIIEQREIDTLSPSACFARYSRGRAMPEEEDPYRTAFQRDRDRILHTKAFRRLKRKTQVFLAPEGDHFRTRLTHTLEVSQIARTISRALFLNEDLTEAIALGHDLGHTPFGHAGETVLNEVYSAGFKHYEQSLRIVEHLEKRKTGAGLNLTWEVRQGILNHSHGKAILYDQPVPDLSSECLVVSLADAIAYINHDIDDALTAGVISFDALPKEAVTAVGEGNSKRINSMVLGVIEGSSGGEINILPEIKRGMRILRDFLYQEVYPREAIESEIRQARQMVRDLYCYLLEHPPAQMNHDDTDDSFERRLVDYIAGMTDEYAMRLHHSIFKGSQTGQR